MECGALRIQHECGQLGRATRERLGDCGLQEPGAGRVDGAEYRRSIRIANGRGRLNGIAADAINNVDGAF